ncbi:MAG: YceD family protein [Bacteroidota bacterium]
MKKRNKEYIIPFKGLKNGIHDFEFNINDAFFSEIKFSEIEHGHLNVSVQLHKHQTFLEFDVNIHGDVELTCDRCLDEYIEEVDFRGSLYVKFGEETDTEDDEIIILSEDEYELDLSHYINESINLSLPLKRVHPDDDKGNPQCNEDMISKLKEHQSDSSKDGNIDPRWNGLRDLLSDN